MTNGMDSVLCIGCIRNAFSSLIGSDFINT